MAVAHRAQPMMPTETWPCNDQLATWPAQRGVWGCQQATTGLSVWMCWAAGGFFLPSPSTRPDQEAIVLGGILRAPERVLLEAIICV
jgi:hypothetical protein